MEKISNKIEKIEFQLTTECNMSCVFCFNGEEISREKLDVETACKTIEDLVHYTKVGSPYVNLKSVWLTGGEPLLEKDSLIKIISVCRSLNIISGLSTNGLLLENHLDELLECGLDEVKISLDSIDNGLFQRLRGGSLSSVLKSIRSASSTRLKTHIRITVTNENINTISTIVQSMAEFNVATIELKAVISVGRANSSFMPNHLQLEKALNEAVTKLPKDKVNTDVFVLCNYLPPCKGFSVSQNIACTCSRSSLYVSANGSIIPCSYFPKESQYNIDRDSIQDAWIGTLFEDVRNSVTSQCKTCADWNSCRNGCPAILYTHDKLNSSCFNTITQLSIK